MKPGDEWITIDERFCGPPRSGNGGYVCGLLAARLAGTVSVRLKAPPPIATRLRIESSADVARLLDGDTPIAEARRGLLDDATVPDAPTLAEAGEASRRFAGFREHNFPTCFVCGPQRAPGDGLRIFPGTLAPSDGETARLRCVSSARDGAPGLTDIVSGPALAAVWTPDPSLADARGEVRPEFVWAALDCPGAFVRYPPPEGVAVVLGELVLESSAPVPAGDACIVTAWSLGDEGRKRRAGTALFDRDGRLLARAQAVWIEVSAAIWR